MYISILSYIFYSEIGNAIRNISTVSKSNTALLNHFFMYRLPIRGIMRYIWEIFWCKVNLNFFFFFCRSLCFVRKDLWQFDYFISYFVNCKKFFILNPIFNIFSTISPSNKKKTGLHKKCELVFTFDISHPILKRNWDEMFNLNIYTKNTMSE